ncbi:MAG: trypco2 family protein [Cuspidothrix sp.]
MSDTFNEIGLGELISKIKEELASTNKDNSVFMVENVELELQVSVSKEIEMKGQGEAKVDLKINVLGADFFKLGEAKGSAEVSRKVNQENIHTIKITLTPAILNQEFMASLPTDKQKAIKQATTGIILQGNNHEIDI